MNTSRHVQSHGVRHSVTRRVTDGVSHDRSHASPDQTRPDQSSLLTFSCLIHHPIPKRHLSDAARFEHLELGC